MSPTVEPAGTPIADPRDVLPIAHYGVIGNLGAVALVGRNGSIDWGAFPHLDRPSTFAALLDRERGGRFQVRAVDARTFAHRYLERTNVLETRHSTGRGTLVITDFMPVAGDLREPVLHACEIHRLLRAEHGDVAVELEWSPRFDYARGRTGIGRFEDGWLAAGAAERMTLAGVPTGAKVSVTDTAHGMTLGARWRLSDGESVALVARYCADDTDASVRDTQKALDATCHAWLAWMARGHDASWAGAHARLVERSALALKLLCHAPTGAIAAAATTSLPEVIGGVRNWDYRYAWLRDAGMTVEALLTLGHPEEAHAFIRFASRAERGRNERDPWLQIVFGLGGETEMPVVELRHLAGYRGSKPVRIGNGIASQRGHDVYEQLLGAALEYLSLGCTLEPDVMKFLTAVADTAAAEWDKPDAGVWEMQRGAQHYVHSKWATSVALDHAVALAANHGLAGDAERWRRTRDAVRAAVIERGYDTAHDRFKLTFNDDALDFAHVLMPVQGFLPAGDPRVASTLAQVMSMLVVDGDCWRYRASDGLPGDEGAFVPCAFWLVEALVLAGRLDEARAQLDHAATRASALGLFSEEFDPKTGEQLGNVPQAFSHVAFVDAAVRLAHAEGRAVPVHPDPARLGADRHSGRTATAD